MREKGATEEISAGLAGRNFAGSHVMIFFFMVK